MLNKKVIMCLIILLGVVQTEFKAQQNGGNYMLESFTSNYLNEKDNRIIDITLGEMYDIMARGKIIVSGKVVSNDNDSISIIDEKDNSKIRIAKTDILKQEKYIKKKFKELPNSTHSKMKFAIINHKNYSSSISCTNLKFINDTTFTCIVNGLPTNFNLSELNSLFILNEHPILLVLNCVTLGGLTYGLATLNMSVLPIFCVGGLVVVTISYFVMKNPTYSIVYNDKNNIITKSDFVYSNIQGKINHSTQDIWTTIDNANDDYKQVTQNKTLESLSSFFVKYSSLFEKYPKSINYYQSAHKEVIKLFSEFFMSYKIGSTNLLDFEKDLKNGLTKHLIYGKFQSGNNVNMNYQDYVVSFYGNNICRVVFEGSDGFKKESMKLKSIVFYK
jgi:hypothetical protein